ncbi:MAG: GNAT family N-acetyltransferase [Calothrix sp. MO_192.B10]|nr:GNAT family N-acetyltransferase [Calothrix sp. MO_192.B10]
MVEFKSVAEDADVRAVVDLSVEIWFEHYVPIIGKAQVVYMLEKFLSPEAIQSQILYGICYQLILMDSIPTGYFAVQQNGNDIFLSKLYVLKKFRGQGIGKQCLNGIFNIYSPNRIFLTVNKYNTTSINFYKSNGFNVIDDVVTDIGGGFVMDDYIMEAQR